MYSWGDIYTWLHDEGEDRVFRLWVFKRMFTPYEQEQKFVDESEYEDTHCKFVRIKELIELADGDYLIGFQNVESNIEYIEYFKLSEIRLNYDPNDINNINGGDDE